MPWCDHDPLRSADDGWAAPAGTRSVFQRTFEQGTYRHFPRRQQGEHEESAENCGSENDCPYVVHVVGRNSSLIQPPAVFRAGGWTPGHCHDSAWRVQLVIHRKFRLLLIAKNFSTAAGLRMAIVAVCGGGVTTAMRGGGVDFLRLAAALHRFAEIRILYVARSLNPIGIRHRAGHDRVAFLVGGQRLD